MRLAQPAGRQFANVHDLERGSCVAANSSRMRPVASVRTVIDGDNLQIGIVDRHERGERRRKLFFFIARGKNKRNTWAIAHLQPERNFSARATDAPRRRPQTVGQPEESNQSEKERVRKDACKLVSQSQPQVILARMVESLSIIGAGRVGRALGRRLRELGWKIGVVSRQQRSRARAEPCALSERDARMLA